MGNLRNLIRAIRSDKDLSEEEWLSLVFLAEEELNTRNGMIVDLGEKLADAKRNQYMFSIGFGKSQENIQALKSALRTFGSCAEGCGGNVGGKAACTCGYHEAIGGE